MKRRFIQKISLLGKFEELRIKLQLNIPELLKLYKTFRRIKLKHKLSIEELGKNADSFITQTGKIDLHEEIKDYFIQLLIQGIEEELVRIENINNYFSSFLKLNLLFFPNKN